MEGNASFGYWLRRRRKALDLTQEELAQQVGCSVGMIRMIEADERRPSRQMAERLIGCLNLGLEERAAFIKAARAELAADRLVSPASAAPPEAYQAVARRQREIKGYELREQAVENPYKGLRAFAEADATGFFGRAALTRRLLERLAEETPQARFLVVVGPSGSGKSSVVRAGLVPALRRGALPGSAQWLVTDMLPGTHPLEELEAALLRIAVNPLPSLLAQLQEDERGLVRAVKRVLPADAETELVLIIDQFEEVFTLGADEGARLHLLNSLHAAVTDPRGRLRVILTLRADFYDRPLLYPDFGDLVRQRTEVVLPLVAEELRQAIVCPAQRVGVTLAADLIAVIMKDVGEQPGTLPLLQYALTELFERRVERRLTLDAYEASGGVLGALAQRAEELYAGLEPQRQVAARQLFLRLVTPGEGVEDTRRRVRRSELLSVVSSPLSVAPENNGPLTTDNGHLAIDQVIDVYSKYRLLTFDRDPITRDATVEVAHEALIRTWSRLRGWLDQGRDDMRQQRRMAMAAAEWLNAGRDPSFLATGARLEQFAGWAAEASLALNQAEQAYLDASITERDRQASAERESQAQKARLARRARNFLYALVLVLLLATVGALTLAGIARRNAAEAQNLALAAGAQAELSRGNIDQALALALAASRMDRPVTLAQLTLAEAAYAPGTRRRFQGHSAPVSAVAFSPDGRAALSASEDQTLILWDALRGTHIRDLTGHKDKVLGVAFSPDGRAALSASLDHTLILWDVASGQLIRRFEGHTDGVLGVAFSPDGRAALSASLDHTLILWDVASGQLIRRFEGHTDGVLGVAFSPDSHTALSASLDRTLILWDVASGQLIHRFQGHADAVNAVSFSPDGQTALSASADRTLILWDVAARQLIRSFQGHTDAVNAVSFSPDGQTAISGSSDTRLGVWDIGTGEPIRFLSGHGGGVKAIASRPDGRSVLSGSADATLRLWDLNNGAEIQRFIGHSDRVRSVAFSPDDRVALSSSEDTTLLLWDVAGGQPIRQLQGHTAGVNGLAFSPDGRTALSSSGDKTLILWDVAGGQPIRHFQGHTAGVTGVAFSQDGQTTLSASLDHTLILWDVATGQPLRHFQGHTDNVYRVAFSPDGRTALSTSGDHTLILWDVASGQLLRRFVGHSGAVRDVAFSSDGRTALSGAEDTFLILWDVATGKPLRRFVGHNAKIYGVAFSPDGRTALSGSTDASVILWNVATGEAIQRFVGHTAEVRDVAFSRDGHAFLTASLDTSVRLWRIDTLDELIAWTTANRYVPELTCDQRKLYRLEPACDDKMTR